MSRRILFMMICVIGLNFSTCFSAKNVSADHAAIGGISTGSSTEYIKSIYGEPGSISTNEKAPNLETWFYGDTFLIDFVDGKASAVVSSGANGLATPDGISVGMKKKSMTGAYGKPQHKEKYGKRALYSYDIEGGAKMIFVVRNGIIAEIRIN